LNPLLQEAKKRPGDRQVEAATKNAKRGIGITATFFFLATSRRLLTPGLRYNLFKVADEKIPLSVVHVNNKPQ
jgi:hypothetical protein